MNKYFISFRKGLLLRIHLVFLVWLFLHLQQLKYCYTDDSRDIIIPITGTVIGILCVVRNRDIVLDIKKRPINVVGTKGLLLLGIKYLLSIIFSCYYQAFTLKLELLGTDFLLENESITISIVLSNSHDNYRLNSHGNRDIFYPYYRNLCKVWISLLHVELVSDLNSMHSHT